MKLSTLCLIALLTTSCAGGDECAWARRITVNDADVISRQTAAQIVAHNRKVSEFCR
jgi:hypothetical protein